MDDRSDLENRYNCVVCWKPQLSVVYGMCQHRVCTSCMYDEKGMRREKMDRCPLCLQCDAFPLIRPPIPEDNVYLLRNIGIEECDKCNTSFWSWEKNTHEKNCSEKENEFIQQDHASTPKLKSSLSIIDDSSQNSMKRRSARLISRQTPVKQTGYSLRKRRNTSS